MATRQGERGAAPKVGSARLAELRRNGLALLRTTIGMFAVDEEDAAEDPTDLETLDGRLAIVAGHLRDRLTYAEADGPTLADTSRLLAKVHTARYEIHYFLANERLRRLDVLDAGLGELRRVQDPDELLNRVCEAVVECCGFDRVMLSRVEDSVWRPWKSYAVTDRETERTFRDWITAIPEIELDHMLLESEMVRRHEPALVVDGVHDRRVYAPLLVASGLKSYVAAPLMPTGRVIGFLHADYEDAQVLPLDRDILLAFSTAFGQIFERAVLLARLRDQRSQVRAAMESVDGMLGDLANAEIDLAARDHPTALAATRPIRMPNMVQAEKLESLMTDRELEVLTLMATGATNRRIAEQLVITDGTVKSHVKRILRKLRANNRSEAISLYLRLTIGNGGA